MKNKILKAAALGMVLTPFGVDAEILSHARLSQILSSQAPGPVDVETMQSRDKDLLVTLGITLREKYGSVLTGSEIVFTRTERAGRIVYRMDFINIKTQDHASGICQILEIENCVIISKSGDTNLISAELDEDGLLSLDHFVPVSGVVRMDKLPTKPRHPSKSVKTMRLPTERPDIDWDGDVPRSGAVDTQASLKALKPADEQGELVEAADVVEPTEVLTVEAEEAPYVDPIVMQENSAGNIEIVEPDVAPALEPTLLQDVEKQNIKSDPVEVDSSNTESFRPTIDVDMPELEVRNPVNSIDDEFIGPLMPGAEVMDETGDMAAPRADDNQVLPGSSIPEASIPSQAPTRPEVSTDVDNIPNIDTDDFIEDGSVSDSVLGTRTVENEASGNPIPHARPSPYVLASVDMMSLPQARPVFDIEPVIASMALPAQRPEAEFGIRYHLPVSRERALLAFSDAASEFYEQAGDSSAVLGALSLISGVSSAADLIPRGHKIVMSSSAISASFADFLKDQSTGVTLPIPGYGEAEISQSIPTVTVQMDSPSIKANLHKGAAGIELEIDGMSDGEAHALPRVFVLNFDDDGVKAFPNAKVEPALGGDTAFEIASVVLNDSFARPFDLRGDGNPDLQKLPKKRPDFSHADGAIQLVSQEGANVLLEQLFESPVKVAQVEDVDPESPGERLMRKLAGMGSGEDSYVEKTVVKPTENVVQPASTKPSEAVPVSEIAPEPLVSDHTPTASTQTMSYDEPREADGLLSLNDEEERRDRALSVLGEIAASQEPVAVPSQSPEYKPTTSSYPTALHSESKGIFDVAQRPQRSIEAASNKHLRIELSYVSSRGEVSGRAKELESYIPDVILDKGRFYGYRVPGPTDSFIIGIEANDVKSRDDIIWYLERMQIPWAVKS